MKISPLAGPSILQPPGTKAATNSVERAIAAFNAGGATVTPAQAPQTHPVQNPTRVSPEELGAIRPPTGQSATSEGQAASDPAAPPGEAHDPATPPTEEPLSTQYAALARREKALRARFNEEDAAMKARETALQTREEAIKAKESEYQTNYIPKSRLQEDAWGVMQEHGVTYEQLTERALNQQQTDPATKAAIDRLEARIRAQDEAVKASQKAQEDAQANAYKQAVAQIKRDAQSLVQSDPEAYEAIAATNSVNDVADLIEATFNQDGILLTVEEAAKEVEEFLVEQSIKVAKLKKIQQRILEPAQPSKQSLAQARQQQPQQMRTLTNAASSGRTLSPRERAIGAFEGRLGK